METSPTGYLSLTGPGRILRANAAAAALLGTSPAELVHQPFARFLPVKARRLWREALQAVRQRGVPAQLELELPGTHEPRSVRVEITATQAGPVRVALEDLTRVRAEAARQARRREQDRLRAEIHDGLGQELTGLQMLLEALLKSRSPLASADLAELAHMQHIVAHALGTCRGLVQDRFSVCASEGGLIGALRHLVELAQLPRRAVVQLWVQESGPIRLPLAQKDQLYRIVQEALNNALKHSGAREISVLVKVTDASVVVGVTDDGRGLPAPLPVSAGLGLRVMRQRAATIRARFSIRPRPAGGTQVRCVCAQPKA